MIAACEERGADLFAAARDGATPPDLAEHLSRCAACAAELEALRPLAAAIPLAHAGVAPRPETRAAVMAALDPRAGDLDDVAPAPRGRMLRLLLPASLVAAAAAAGVLLALQPPAGEGRTGPGVVNAASGAVLLRSGPPAGELGAAETLDAGEVAEARGRTGFQFRFPSGTEVEVVAADGVRIRATPAAAGASPTLVLSGAAGPAWFRTDPRGGGIEIVSGGIRVAGQGAVTVMPGEGATAVLVQDGTFTVGAGGATAGLPVRGPARVEVADGGAPGQPVPGEAPDARAWFHHPVVSLAEEAGPHGPEWIVRLLPSIPEPLPVAPWDHFDPLFSLLLTGEDGTPRPVAVRRGALAGPAPEGEPAGPFLLGPDRPYILRVNPSALGVPAGRYRVVATYTASRPGGTWRGTAQAPPVTLEAR